MSENREDFKEMIEDYKVTTETSKPELGMNWFKFLIYFLLFFGAAENLLDSVMMLFNLRHELWEMDYYFGGNFRWLGILFGVIWIITAAVQIYLRFELAKFKKNAPKKYIIFEIVDAVLYLAYNLVGGIISAGSDRGAIIGVTVGSIIGASLGAIAYIYPNIIYFRKRNHLFIN